MNNDSYNPYVVIYLLTYKIFIIFTCHTYRSDAASSKRGHFNFIQNLGGGGGGGNMETPPVLRSPSGTEKPYFEEN